VEDHDPHTTAARILEQRAEEERVGLTEVDVGVAKAGVHLERPVRLSRHVERKAEQRIQ
jgi:hypothetical protein